MNTSNTQHGLGTIGDTLRGKSETLLLRGSGHVNRSKTDPVFGGAMGDALRGTSGTHVLRGSCDANRSPVLFIRVDSCPFVVPLLPQA